MAQRFAGGKDCDSCEHLDRLAVLRRSTKAAVTAGVAGAAAAAQMGSASSGSASSASSSSGAGSPSSGLSGLGVAVAAATAASLATAAAVAASTSGSGSQPDAPAEYKGCPADKEQLGNATWTFLHTMAALYPDHPTPEQQETMKTFLGSFSKVYPCSYCAAHLQERMQTHPARVRSRFDLSMWLCETHNEVNERLGKPQFDCARVFERWRDGWKDGSCDPPSPSPPPPPKQE